MSGILPTTARGKEHSEVATTSSLWYVTCPTSAPTPFQGIGAATLLELGRLFFKRHTNARHILVVLVVRNQQKGMCIMSWGLPVVLYIYIYIYIVITA